MSEWTVITVIVTLVGLGAAVLRPLINLNSVITRLTEVVKALDGDFAEMSQKNSDAHGRIWEKVEEHDDAINVHEVRLTLIENKAPK